MKHIIGTLLVIAFGLYMTDIILWIAGKPVPVHKTWGPQQSMHMAKLLRDIDTSLYHWDSVNHNLIYIGNVKQSGDLGVIYGHEPPTKMDSILIYLHLKSPVPDYDPHHLIHYSNDSSAFAYGTTIIMQHATIDSIYYLHADTDAQLATKAWLNTDTTYNGTYWTQISVIGAFEPNWVELWYHPVLKHNPYLFTDK